MTKTLTLQELEAALGEFGYVQRQKSNQLIFEHPHGRSMIVLPRMSPKSSVSPLHRKIVERTIRDDGAVDWDEVDFYMDHGKRREKTIKKGDRLVWTVPGSAQEIKVVAAAGEQDDMVIVKQNGTFSPCPVNQLRKDDASGS